MIRKKTKQATPKPVVTDEAKAMLVASANDKPPRKPRTTPVQMEVLAKIHRKDLGADATKFIESVSKSSGMSVKDIICCMVRMSRNTGRVNGPRHFAPQLKRFSK